MPDNKSGYCECPKNPGGILEIQGELRDMIHAGCGKKIGPMPKERKPVYCSHRNRVGQYGNDCARYECGTCEAKWESWEGEPKVEIGWFEVDA